MFQKYGNRLKLTRGDSAYLEIEILNDHDGNPLTNSETYDLKDGDSIIFLLKKNPSDTVPLIVRTFLDKFIKIYSIDTNSLEPGKYCYSIQIQFANGDVNTIVDCEPFEIVKDDQYRETYSVNYLSRTDNMQNPNKLIGRIKEYTHYQSQSGSSQIVIVNSIAELPAVGVTDFLYVCKDDGSGASAVYVWDDNLKKYLCCGINDQPLEMHISDYNNPHNVELEQVAKALTNEEIQRIMTS